MAIPARNFRVFKHFGKASEVYLGIDRRIFLQFAWDKLLCQLGPGGPSPGALLIVVLLGLLSGLGAGQTANDKSERLVKILLAVQGRMENDDRLGASELLEEAIPVAREIGQENQVLREEVLFRAANVDLDLAQQFTNSDQIEHYANRSRSHWKEYIEWFRQLSEVQREALGGNNRVHKATAFLGNANVRMHKRRQLFTDYENIPDVTVLGPDAIDLWERTLYECPDWRFPSIDERSTTGFLQRQICTELCKTNWLVYSETVSEWVESFPLRRAVKIRRLEKVQRIKEIAQECPE